MRKLAVRLLFGMCFLFSGQVFAMLSMELTRGVAGAVPIAITPFAASSGLLPEDVSGVISHDLKNSGRFRVYNDKAKSEEVAIHYFRGIGVDTVVLGQVQEVGADRYRVTFKLLDVFKNKKSSSGEQQAVLLNQSFTVTGGQLRPLAHHIADLIYRQILGVRGIFSTRLTYIVVQRPANAPARYLLEVADQDGYNPRPLLTSSEPIMSPAWSPDGKKIAYVSFENKRASIYVHDVATGARRRVSSFKGMNQAPAWSPDGSKLALVLSKDGSPNIYVLNITSGQLTRLTHDWGISTEPSWAPDGKSIIFTSNRSGGPQIYQKNLRSGSVTRLTYEGNYNARASFTPDGNHLVLLNQQDRLFNIGILDLNSGVFRVLTSASGTDNESPSVAPNGSMVVYGTLYGGRSILAMTASDASVQIRLPARNGEVQDPAWSPFLG